MLSHEMAHVIARHAAIREDQARQAALVSRVATDLLNDPQLGAMALAKIEDRARELLARPGARGRRRRRRHSARAGFDPYGAVRFLTAMGRNADTAPRNTASIRARPTSSRRIRRRRTG